MDIRARAIGLAFLCVAATGNAYDLERIGIVEDPQILGRQGNADADACAMLDDGSLIGFLSGATNLVAGDQNGRVDAMLDTGSSLERISRSIAGGEATLDARAIAISSNGQFVAFRLDFDPDVLAATEWGRIYRLNRNNGNLLMVADYAPVAPGTRATLAISDDGRYVAYASNFAVVAARPGNRVFRFDAQSGNTVLVDVDTGAAGQNGNAGGVAMDANGDLVAFDSDEADLVGSDTNGVRDVFVRDLAAGTTTRVSRRNNGTQGNGASELADFSDDGNSVLFSSDATNLDSLVADANALRDVFRFNFGSGNTRRVSLDENGQQMAYASIGGAVSGDGQFVWLISYRNGNRPQLWRKNMATEAMLQITDSAGSVSQVDADDAGTGACFIASYRSTDLASGDSNARNDVYRAGVSPGQVVTIAREGQADATIDAHVLAEDMKLTGIDDAGLTAVVLAKSPQFDADTFADLSLRNEYRAYLIDTRTRAVDAPCRNASGTHTNGDCTVAAISGNGRYVFFASDGSNLHADVPDAPVNWSQIYRRDLQTGAVTYVTRSAAGGVATNGASGTSAIAVDEDGDRAVFFSSSDELVANDTNGVADVFLWDATTGISRISLRSNGSQATTSPYDRPFISGNGGLVVFAHADGGLVAGDTNNTVDLFLYDVASGTHSRIAQPTMQTTLVSRALDFSRDGEWLALKSAAGEFNDPSGSDLFLWRRSTNQLLELANDLVPGDQYSEPVAFMRNNFGLVFGVDSDPSPSAATITLNRRYFSLFPMTPVFDVPATPSPDLRTYALGDSMAVAADENAYVTANWPLDTSDNNRRDDIGLLQSGYGVAEFPAATVNVGEAAGTLDFEVLRRFGQAFDASVYAVAVNGTAVGGSDFNAPVGGVFAAWLDGTAGASPGSIQIIDDGTPEPTQSFTLTLQDYSVVTPGAITALTVNIIDDDGSDLIFTDGFD